MAELEQLAERYHALYETADPAALLTSVAAHMRLVQDALRQDPMPEERRQLLRNLAEVAILAGRLAADDLGNTMSGRAYYSMALDAAREVTDAQLTAITHGHTAQLAAAEGLTVAALDRLTVAREQARSTPAIASWLATIEATIHAARGDHAAAHHALDRAQTALDQPGGRLAPASFHDHGTTQVTAATGRVLLRLGDYSHACEVLTAAVADLRSTERRQRVQVLIDLATVELHGGNLSAACSHATQAAELLQQVTYALGTALLHAFRTAAERPLNSGALRALDEYLIRIAA